MSTYYLYQDDKDGRQIIDSTFPNSAFRVIDSRQADCWIAAKKAFGFELTPVQEYLLTEFRRKAA